MVYLSNILLRGFTQYPERIKRLFIHPFQFIANTDHLRSNDLKEFLGDYIFYIIDCLFFPEFHDIFYQTIFWGRSRKISRVEQSIAERIFKDRIDFRFCFINNKAFRFTSKYATAYVGFSTIYFRGKTLESDIFIHECVHIWQFQYFGSVYLYRALLAHHRGNPYDYGNINRLKVLAAQNFKFVDFNFEQQAQIVEDYFRLITTNNSYPVKNPDELVYEYFIRQLRSM